MNLYCGLEAYCLAVLLPPTGESLSRLDLLERTLLVLFKSGCFFIGFTQC